MWKCTYCGNDVGIIEKQDKFHELNKSGKIQKSFIKLSTLWALECSICGVLMYLEKDDMSGKTLDKEEINKYCYREV